MVHVRMYPVPENGLLDRVVEQLQRQQIMRLKLEAVSLYSAIVKVHPDSTGVRRGVLSLSSGPAAAVLPRFIWLPRTPGQL